MEFFGMGPLEVVLILVVGLIARGPGRLPQLARNLGKGIRAFRKATFDLTSEISRELEEEESQKKQASSKNEQPQSRIEKAAGLEASNSGESGDL